MMTLAILSVISFLPLVIVSINLTALFEPYLSPGANLILPGDIDWGSKVQARWSDYTAPTFIGVIKPMTESDIQYTVRIPSKAGTKSSSSHISPGK